MPRAPLTGLLSLSMRCRGYAASASADAQHLASSVAMAARAEGGSAAAAAAAAAGKEVFWMRDPKSGNWIPENRFADVDAAELRAQLLGTKG